MPYTPFSLQYRECDAHCGLYSRFHRRTRPEQAASSPNTCSTPNPVSRWSSRRPLVRTRNAIFMRPEASMPLSRQQGIGRIKCKMGLAQCAAWWRQRGLPLLRTIILPMACRMRRFLALPSRANSAIPIKIATALPDKMWISYPQDGDSLGLLSLDACHRLNRFRTIRHRILRPPER